MQMNVIKLTGEREPFSKRKLCTSIERAGAPKELAEKICSQVEEKFNPDMSTDKIYREALRYLLKESRELAARYSIRRGVAALGPAGYVFEQYVEIVLQSFGYETMRNQMMKGDCVTHEIDVVAFKNNTHYLLEMKYHNENGIRTHINVVMYAYARLLDIAGALSKKENSPHNHMMWLVTNTKFTDTAITYAKCKNIVLTGWDYPRGNSLEDMIIEKKLYPVTVLPTVTSGMLEILSRKGIILAQDLLPYSPLDLSKLLMIDEKTAEKVISDVQMLLSDNLTV